MATYEQTKRQIIERGEKKIDKKKKKKKKKTGKRKEATNFKILSTFS